MLKDTADKPWVTDGFRKLIRESKKLRLDFYKSKVRNINELSSHAWWKNMKHLIGQSPDSNLEMQCLANKNNDGDCLSLANDINEFLASVCSDLPRLTNANAAFTLEGEIPN